MLSDKLRLVLNAVERAAAHGAPCTTNQDIADIVGALSVSSGPQILARLEKLGLIRVERFQAHRRVTVVSSGRSTYVPPNASRHWRDVQNRPAAPKRVYRKADSKVASREAEHGSSTAIRVHRDPCPRCGVRADYGCAHSPTRLGTAFSA